MLLRKNNPKLKILKENLQDYLEAGELNELKYKDFTVFRTNGDKYSNHFFIPYIVTNLFVTQKRIIFVDVIELLGLFRDLLDLTDQHTSYGAGPVFKLIFYNYDEQLLIQLYEEEIYNPFIEELLNLNYEHFNFMKFDIEIWIEVEDFFDIIINNIFIREHTKNEYVKACLTRKIGDYGLFLSEKRLLSPYDVLSAIHLSEEKTIEYTYNKKIKTISNILSYINERYIFDIIISTLFGTSLPLLAESFRSSRTLGWWLFIPSILLLLFSSVVRAILKKRNSKENINEIKHEKRNEEYKNLSKRKYNKKIDFDLLKQTKKKWKRLR